MDPGLKDHRDDSHFPIGRSIVGQCHLVRLLSGDDKLLLIAAIN